MTFFIHGSFAQEWAQGTLEDENDISVNMEMEDGDKEGTRLVTIQEPQVRDDYWGTVVVVQSLSRVQLFVTPWTIARQALHPSLSPGICSDSCPLRR